MFAGNATYTLFVVQGVAEVVEQAVIECTVPAPCLLVPVVTAGTGGRVGTSWVRMLLLVPNTDAMTPNTGPTGSFPAVT